MSFVKRPGVWLLLALPLAAVVPAALAVYLPREDRPLVSDRGGWKSSPNFSGAEPGTEFVYAENEAKQDSIYWVLAPSVGNGSGRLVSPPFDAPPWIGLIVTGDLTRPGNEVYFRLDGEDRRLRVSAHTAPYFWRRVTCRLPSDWLGKPVRLIAEAGPRTTAANWFGLSNPRALGTGTVLRSHLRTLAVLPAYAAGLLIFLLPGLPPSLWLAGRGGVPHSFALPAAIVFSCLAGYLTFWAYFIGAGVGFCFGIVVLSASAVALAVVLWRDGASRAVFLSADVVTPLALTALVGAFYLALTHSVNLWMPLSEVPELRFLEFVLPRDNDLPYFFAETLYNGIAPRGILVGEWHFSDRPPLQAGLLLLQLPLGYLVRQPAPWSHAAAVAFQCAWVPAVLALGRAAGLSRRRSGLTLVFVALTGFALVNTVFTWPKLLAAGLTVFAATLALFDRGPDGRAMSPSKAGLFGVSAALAFLSHGSVAFTLLPLGLILLVPRYYPGLSRLAAAGVAFAAVVYPWMWFQSHYDPPGNLLIRQHVAGRSESWDDSRPLWRNLLDAYTERSPGQILHNKAANVEVLFAASRKPAADQFPWPPNGSPESWPVDSTSLRRCEFLCLFWAPGLLNLGWLVALSAAWRRRRTALDARLGYVAPLLVLASTLTWALVMFGPGSTVIHQGSYATVLLLLTALAAWLTTLPTRLAYFVLTLQGMLFTIGWLLTSPANDYGLANPVMIALAVGFFAVLVKVALGSAAGEAVPAVQEVDSPRTVAAAEVIGAERQNRKKLPGRPR